MPTKTITIDGLEIAVFKSHSGDFVAAFENRNIGLLCRGATEISACARLIERYAEYLGEQLIAELGK